jgi:hypothetical protein
MNLWSTTDKSNKIIQQCLQNVDSRLLHVDVENIAAHVEGVRLSNKFDSTITLIHNDFQSLANISHANHLTRQETDLATLVTTTESINKCLNILVTPAASIPTASAPHAAAGNSTISTQTGNPYHSSTSGPTTTLAQCPVHGSVYAMFQ